MTERATYAKSTCCIPGCPRWSRRFPGEWMCARHWRSVPLRCRRALQSLWAEWGAMATTYADIPKEAPEARRRWRHLYFLHARLWAHAKRRAIFQAAGI